MPGVHKELTLAMLRRTEGDFGKEAAPISLGLLVRLTGRNRSHLQRALADLRAAGVVKLVRQAGFTDPQWLALNADYHTWGVYAPERPVRAEATGREEAANSTPGGATTVRAQATIKDKSKTKRQEQDSSPKRPVVSAPSDVDWQARSDAVLARSHFPSDLLQLGEMLAGENKTGKAAVSRIVRELYEPLVGLQDELSDDALRYGLRAAITAGAPNCRYVSKAAASYSGNGNLAPTSRLGGLDDYDRDFLTEG